MVGEYVVLVELCKGAPPVGAAYHLYVPPVGDSEAVIVTVPGLQMETLGTVGAPRATIVKFVDAFTVDAAAFTFIVYVPALRDVPLSTETSPVEASTWKMLPGFVVKE